VWDAGRLASLYQLSRDNAGFCMVGRISPLQSPDGSFSPLFRKATRRVSEHPPYPSFGSYGNPRDRTFPSWVAYERHLSHSAKQEFWLSGWLTVQPHVCRADLTQPSAGLPQPLPGIGELLCTGRGHPLERYRSHLWWPIRTSSTARASQSLVCGWECPAGAVGFSSRSCRLCVGRKSCFTLLRTEAQSKQRRYSSCWSAHSRLMVMATS
jgi:hypothetical protein